MKKTLKANLAKATNSSIELNKKALKVKTSWDEVAGILNSAGRHNKKSGK